MPEILWKLLKKKLGFRQLMDVIPLDASLVQGTHGRIDNEPGLQPVMLGGGHAGETLECTAVRDVILEAMGIWAKMTPQASTHLIFASKPYCWHTDYELDSTG